MSESVFLLNPPGAVNREGAAGLGAPGEEGGFSYPPHTLAAAAGVLRGAGKPVTVLDAQAERLEAAETAARIIAARPEVVALFASALSLAGDVEMLRALRRAYPPARYLLFGPGLAAVRGDIPADLPGAAVLGEPEAALPQALAGEIGPEPPWVEDLDRLPFPAWDLLDASRYPFLTILSSRGCGHGCLYCPYTVAQGRAFRPRSVESVLAELHWLRETFRPGRIVFRDPAFAADPARVAALCRGILGDPALRPGSGPAYWWWECEGRPEPFERALLHEMRRAGCLSLKVGLETVDPALLNVVGRAGAAAAYRARAAALVEDCRREGIRCRLFVMVGLPGETAQAVAETAAFLRDVRPAGVQVKRYVAYPGLDWPKAPPVPAPEEVDARYDELCRAAEDAARPPSRASFWRRLLTRK